MTRPGLQAALFSRDGRFWLRVGSFFVGFVICVHNLSSLTWLNHITHVERARERARGRRKELRRLATRPSMETSKVRPTAIVTTDDSVIYHSYAGANDDDDAGALKLKQSSPPGEGAEPKSADKEEEHASFYSVVSSLVSPSEFVLGATYLVAIQFIVTFAMLGLGHVRTRLSSRGHTYMNESHFRARATAVPARCVLARVLSIFFHLAHSRRARCRATRRNALLAGSICPDAHPRPVPTVWRGAHVGHSCESLVFWRVLRHLER